MRRTQKYCRKEKGFWRKVNTDSENKKLELAAKEWGNHVLLC